jgi:glycosyltransferase involved in cell wall biosynthesis
VIAQGRVPSRARPRVLFAGPLPPPHHGCAVITRNLLDSSLADRFELVHLDTADRRGVENIGRFDIGNVWRAGMHGAQFLRLLGTAKPDLVYLMIAQNTWGFLRDALFMSPAALRAVPLVLHFQSGQFDQFVAGAAAPLRALIRSLIARADRAVVLGHALAPMLEGLLPAERIAVVPNAVPDITTGTRAPRRGTRIRALYLGNLIPGKGYLEVADAARALLAEGADIEFTFAGHVSDNAAHQRALAIARMWPDRIRFVGPVAGDAKVQLLGESDFLVFPSHYENEGHPLVVLEAMAAALPVISTRYVAIPETVLHGETGLLVDVRDTTALVAAIRSLSADAALRARLGDAGRVRYLQHYTLDAWAARLGDIFDDVLVARAA